MCVEEAAGRMKVIRKHHRRLVHPGYESGRLQSRTQDAERCHVYRFLHTVVQHNPQLQSLTLSFLSHRWSFGTDTRVSTNDVTQFVAAQLDVL